MPWAAFWNVYRRASRVAIVRLRSLGDCVLTTPALDILRRSRPDLRISIVVEDRFRAIFEENPDLDEILPPSLGTLRRWSPRVCVNLHGGSRSAWMSALSGAEHRAGFGHFRHGWMYNARIPRAQEILGSERTVHTAEHLASAMFWLGAPLGEIPRARLFAPPNWRESQGRHSSGGRHAGKNLARRRISRCCGALPRIGLEPVFIGAASDNLTPFRAYTTMAGAPLAEIKSLLAGASFFVGNDSGPAHMAAAFGLPVVVIFGNSNPAIWGPWRTASEVVTAGGGIGNVAISQVMDALGRLRVHA